jgi:hypothetical protein
VLSRFRSTSQEFGEPGHTHGPLDQRFSVVMSSLGVAPVLANIQVHVFRKPC